MSIPDQRSWGTSMRYIGVVVAVYEGSGEERRDRDWRKSAARGGGGQGLIGRVTSTLAPNGGYALGNVSCFGSGPLGPNEQSPGQAPGITNEQHETAHTYQGEALGPFYLPAYGVAAAIG